MKRPKLVVALVVAAALVMIENWVYFRNDAGTDARRSALDGRASGSSEELEGASHKARPSIKPPAQLTRAHLSDMLLAIDFERSPFQLASELYGGVERDSSRLPQLAGTLVGNGRRIAWVDGRPRREGEHHGAFLVSEVDPERVVLVREGRRYMLELPADHAAPEDPPDPDAARATPDPAAPEEKP